MENEKKLENDKELLSESEQLEIAGGKRVNFFGFSSKTGNYTKCDFCGKYGAMPLVNGKDTCLSCLDKLKATLGQENVIKLLVPGSDSGSNPSSSTKNITITTSK